MEQQITFNRGAIREILDQFGHGPKEFSEQTGLNRNHIHIWEAGMSTPNLKSIIEIMNAYGIDDANIFLSRS